MTHFVRSLGEPTRLRKAARWSLLAVLVVALVGQFLGVGLIAPAHAAPEDGSGGFELTCFDACKLDLVRCVENATSEIDRAGCVVELLDCFEQCRR